MRGQAGFLEAASSQRPDVGWEGQNPSVESNWRGGRRSRGVAVSGGFRQVPVPQSEPSLRFQSLLVKPGVRVSRIRLSDWFHPQGPPSATVIAPVSVASPTMATGRLAERRP